MIIRTIFGFHGGDHGGGGGGTHGAGHVNNTGNTNDSSVLYEPSVARDLDGTLLHVRHRGKLFSIISNSTTGLTMLQEEEEAP